MLPLGLRLAAVLYQRGGGEMAKPIKKKFPWMLFILILLACQYVAAHVSGWLNEVGVWDIMQLGSLPDYFKSHPFDVVSFQIMPYLMVYGTGMAAFCHHIFHREPPKAEMKGEEHGSNDFMTSAEMATYVATRISPDFAYSEDCTIPAAYPKREVRKWQKRKRKMKKK